MVRRMSAVDLDLQFGESLQISSNIPRVASRAVTDPTLYMGKLLTCSMVICGGWRGDVRHMVKPVTC